MASTTNSSGPLSRNSVGIIEFAFARTRFPNRRQHAALHIHYENLVTQSVRDVNALGRRIDRDSSGTFEISFSAFQAADRMPELPLGVENKNLPDCESVT